MNRKIQDAFQAVHAEDSLKRNTRSFLAQQMRRGSVRSPRPRLAVAMSCLVFLFILGFGGWHSYFTPVSAISVDVNPSLELLINRFDRVVKVDTFNEDAARLAGLVQLKYLPYMEALTVLFSSEAMIPYLHEDSLVSLSIIADTRQKSQEMYSHLSHCTYEKASRVECHFGHREEVEAAHEAGLSFGKYRVYQKLLELDETITLQEVQGLSMRELRDHIHRLSKDAHEGTCQNGSKECGHGEKKCKRSGESSDPHSPCQGQKGHGRGQGGACRQDSQGNVQENSHEGTQADSLEGAQADSLEGTQAPP